MGLCLYMLLVLKLERSKVGAPIFEQLVRRIGTNIRSQIFFFSLPIISIVRNCSLEECRLHFLLNNIERKGGKLV